MDDPTYEAAIPLERAWPSPPPQPAPARRPRRRLALAAAVALVVALVGVIAAMQSRQDSAGPPLHQLDTLPPQVTNRHTSFGTTDATETTVVPLARSTAPPGTTQFLITQRPYDVGDCVTWDQVLDERYLHDSEVVACDLPHLLEMTGDTSITTPFDHYPSDEEWAAAIPVDCTAAAERRLQAKVDPSGRFFVTALAPSLDTWPLGDRTLRCALGARDGSERELTKKRIPFTGTVNGSNQEQLFPIGTCLDAVAATSCDGPHTMQVTGTVDLTARVVYLPATTDNAAWERLITADCSQALASAVGPVAPTVHWGWRPISPESWAAGSHILHCVAGVTAPGSDAFVVSTGPLVASR